MTHEVIRHLLDDYVTGDLSEDARAPVTDHIAACEICRSEVAESRRPFTSRAAGCRNQSSRPRMRGKDPRSDRA